MSSSFALHYRSNKRAPGPPCKDLRDKRRSRAIDLMDLSAETSRAFAARLSGGRYSAARSFSSDRNKRIWDLKVNHLGSPVRCRRRFQLSMKRRPSPVYVSWKDLGLPADKPVHVFDFWNKEYLGAWEKGMTVDLRPRVRACLHLCRN